MKAEIYDEQYHRFAEAWIRRHASDYRSLEEMEDHLDEIAVQFADTPAAWLRGRTPRAYFAGIEDPAALIDLLADFDAVEAEPPDLLLDRFGEIGDAAALALMGLAADREKSPRLRTRALKLLNEMQREDAMDLCLSLVEERAVRDPVADAAAELLMGLGERAVGPMRARLSTASEAAFDTWLDLLCDQTGDDAVLEAALDAFRRRPGRRAFYAACLGKLGDPRALSTLKQAMAGEDIGYLEYLEIVNAMEQLGAEPIERSRDFSGDADFEAMRNA